VNLNLTQFQASILKKQLNPVIQESILVWEATMLPLFPNCRCEISNITTKGKYPLFMKMRSPICCILKKQLNLVIQASIQVWEAKMLPLFPHCEE